MRMKRLAIVPMLLTALTGCGVDAPVPQPIAVEAVAAPTSPGSEWLKGEPVGSEPTMFVVLAGDWKVREEGGDRVLRVDGTNWKVGTPPASLAGKAGALFPTSAGAFEQRVLAGLQFPYGVVRSAGTFGNGELQVDFKLVGGASDQFASLLFGLTDDANHHAFRYNTKDGDTALWKVVDGKRERLHHGGIPVKVALGDWHTLRLRIDGAQLTGWVDTTEALTFTLPKPVTGLVGLWSKADSVTDYRGFHAK